MKKRLMLLVLALSAIAITCPDYVNAKSKNDSDITITNSVKKIFIKRLKTKQTRTCVFLPEVYLNEAEYRLYVIHPQNGDMGTFRIDSKAFNTNEGPVTRNEESYNYQFNIETITNIKPR